MKTKKPARFKPRNPRKPKWAPPERDTEPAVCNTIRRNVRNDTARLRSLENRHAALLDRQRTVEADVGRLRLYRAQLVEAANDVPVTVAPDTSHHSTPPRGKIGALYRVLRALGHLLDLRDILSAGDRVRRVAIADQEIAEKIEALQRQLADVRTAQTQVLVDLRDVEEAIRRSFLAFDRSGCGGELFNEVQFAPPMRKRLR
jgi:chaperonin cofactor prefoldin